MWKQDAPYGQEWIMNGYVLYERGIAIVGPDPKSVFRPISRGSYRRASIRSLHEEWAPLLTDAPIVHDSHHQAYVTLSVCPNLHTAKNDGVASKRVASQWVKRIYGEQWHDLIEKAERWRHGEELNETAAVLDFIRFTLIEVGDTLR